MAIRKAMVAADGSVVNVVSLHDDWSADDPKAWKPPPGIRLLDADDSAEPGGAFDDQTGAFSPRPVEPPVELPPTAEQNRIAALEKSIQALVDNDVIARDALPDEIKGRIEDKRAP